MYRDREDEKENSFAVDLRSGLTQLTQRGIEIQEQVLRQEAVELFKEFSAGNGFIYNYIARGLAELMRTSCGGRE